MTKLEELRAKMRELTGGQYDGTTNAPTRESIQHSDGPAPHRAIVSTDAQTTHASQATADNRTQDESSSPTLSRIETVTGTLRAYDGRYCVWGSNGPFDIRDVARRLGLHHMDVVDALPTFAPVKRGRRTQEDDDDTTLHAE